VISKIYTCKWVKDSEGAWGPAVRDILFSQVVKDGGPTTFTKWRHINPVAFDPKTGAPVDPTCDIEVFGDETKGAFALIANSVDVQLKP
jgi:hypothetical protein